MNRRILLLPTLAAALLALVPEGRADITERPAPANPDAIRVVTANLRQLWGTTEVDNSETDLDSWIYRKDICRDVLLAQKAEIYCFQECRMSHLEHFMAAMPGFAFYALRVPSGPNMYPSNPGNAIFYSTERFDLLEADGFWLSGTPQAPQTAYPDCLSVRFANWVKLKDKNTNRVFKVWNLHLDHQTGTAGGVLRGKQIKVLLDAADAEPAGSPQILTGDLNSAPVFTPEYAAYKQLTDNDWTDTWTELGNSENSHGTTNGNFAGTTSSNKIDYIFHRGKFRATRAEIITDFRAVESVNRYPSDHYFVSADIEFDTSGGAIPDPAGYTSVKYNEFSEPVGMATDTAGNLYVADEGKHVIKRIAAPGVSGSASATVFAGAGAPGCLDSTAGGRALLNRPRALALQDGTWYVADSGNQMLRIIDAATTAVSRYAGAPARGPEAVAVDGDLDTARFALPASVAVAPDGAIYIADAIAHAIRKIATDGAVTTFAGELGCSGTANGAGADARFNEPLGLAVDDAGQNLYVADTGNHAIRKIALGSATVTTLAGAPGVSGTDNGTAATARFNSPAALAFASGTVYVADTGNHTIRAVDAETGAARLLTGTPGKEMPVIGINKVQDGAPSQALFSYPAGIAAGASGNLYVADTGNAAIRRVELANGDVTRSLFEVSGTKTASTDDIWPSDSTGGENGGNNNNNGTGSNTVVGTHGGGAPSLWFPLSLTLLAAARALRRRIAAKD